MELILKKEKPGLPNNISSFGLLKSYLIGMRDKQDLENFFRN